MSACIISEFSGTNISCFSLYFGQLTTSKGQAGMLLKKDITLLSHKTWQFLPHFKDFLILRRFCCRFFIILITIIFIMIYYYVLVWVPVSGTFKWCFKKNLWLYNDDKISDFQVLLILQKWHTYTRFYICRYTFVLLVLHFSLALFLVSTLCWVWGEEFLNRGSWHTCWHLLMS